MIATDERSKSATRIRDGLKGSFPALRQFAGRYVRGRSAFAAAARLSGAPKVIFLPSMGPSGSSLLRIYNMAVEMERHGWAALVIHPSLSRKQRERIYRRVNPDLFITQGTRHPLNRKAFLPDVPYLLDLDDADFNDPVHAQPLADMASAASGVVSGSRYIARWARERNPNVEVIWTGAPAPENAVPMPEHKTRPAIVCWAQTTPLEYPTELSFVADIVEAALSGPLATMTFRLYDMTPDDADRLPAIFRDSRITMQFFPKMEYRAFIASLRDVSVGLCPLRYESPFSRGKSFGKILAYLEAKVPVICNDMADHALFFSPQSGSIRETPEEFAAEIAALLSDPTRRQSISDAAFDDFTERLSSSTSARRLMDSAHRCVPALAVANQGQRA